MVGAATHFFRKREWLHIRHGQARGAEDEGKLAAVVQVVFVEAPDCLELLNLLLGEGGIGVQRASGPGSR